MKLVAWLGGLVVLRDLETDSKWEALEKEEAFAQLRKLFLAQGLKTVVGISLQAKDRVFGVLVLGTPDNRSFTPAELRLLLALGHQIGMAVENSYLVQQTSRRSEELHILNEIGRTLNSTLDLGHAVRADLFGDAAPAGCVAAWRSRSTTARMDRCATRWKWSKASGMPKRTRAAGNFMPEYVVRTGQPLLIRENFAKEMSRIGIEIRAEVGFGVRGAADFVRPVDRDDGGEEPARARV